MLRVLFIVALVTFATAFVYTPLKSKTSTSVLFSEKGIYIHIIHNIIIYLYY